MTSHLTPEETAVLAPVASSENVPYLPIPNKVDAVLSDRVAPDALNPTAFTFAFRDDGMAWWRLREAGAR